MDHSPCPIPLLLGALLLPLVLLIHRYLTRPRRGRNFLVGDRLDLVVARYAEDLNWLRRPQLRPLWPRVIIYNKGPDNLATDIVAGVRAVHRLPNVGRCDHTYLYHIVHHYNHLADLTLLVPGCVDAEERKEEALLEALWRARYGMVHITEPHVAVRRQGFVGDWGEVEALFGNFEMREWRSTTVANRQENPDTSMQPAQPRPFGPWLRSILPDYVPQPVVIHFGGVIPAFRENVLWTPLPVFRELLRQCGQHPNPEVGHYIERIWGLLVDTSAFPTFVGRRLLAHAVGSPHPARATAA